MTGKLNFVDFEQPIAELHAKIEELRMMGADSGIDINSEIQNLQQKSRQLTESIFASLTPWQIVKLARHPLRPYTLDYIDRIFTDFEELHGDRHYADDASLVCGLARFKGQPVMIIGHQKGRRTSENIYRNFGMSQPEGYRKALRILELAEKFNLPVFTFINTPGAYAGIAAEEHNQSEAIARNLYVMAKLKTPIICTVIGEGGSGGALAIGVGDRALMLSYSVYSVISAEGCASILWKSAEKAELAAEAMKMTSRDALEHKLIDEIVEEPLGGAHRDVDAIANTLSERFASHLNALQQLSTEELLAQRYQRLRRFGLS